MDDETLFYQNNIYLVYKILTLNCRIIGNFEKRNNNNSNFFFLERIRFKI